MTSDSFIKDFPQEESEGPADEILYLEESESPPIYRITVVDKLYHTQGHHPPKEITCKFNKQLSSEEPGYIRPGIKVEETWTALDFGWVGENVGTIVLENVTGKYLRRIPTEEKRKELDKQVLEISIVSCNLVLTPDESYCSFAYVYPGASFRIHPSNPLSLFVRSCCGTVEYNLYAIPK